MRKQINSLTIHDVPTFETYDESIYYSGTDALYNLLDDLKQIGKPSFFKKEFNLDDKSDDHWLSNMTDQEKMEEIATWVANRMFLYWATAHPKMPAPNFEWSEN